MNQRAIEHYSKVERVYNVKAGRHYKCPVCKQKGTPVKGNYLVMEHKVDNKGVTYHRWSFASGRIVELQAESTNVL
jgi:hypothetical protein